jgi:hypothetical protein
MIGGNDLIINNEKYKGTRGLWKLLTNPNREKLYIKTYSTWWNKDNFTEKGLNIYIRKSLRKHISKQ